MPFPARRGVFTESPRTLLFTYDATYRVIHSRVTYLVDLSWEEDCIYAREISRASRKFDEVLFCLGLVCVYRA